MTPTTITVSASEAQVIQDALAMFRQYAELKTNVGEKIPPAPNLESNLRSGYLSPESAVAARWLLSYFPLGNSYSRFQESRQLLQKLKGSVTSVHPQRWKPEVTSVPIPEGQPVKLVVLGDFDGKQEKIQAILDHEFPHGKGIALAVGDLATYKPLKNGHRVYFVHGNHEHFPTVWKMRSTPDPTYQPLLAGDVLLVGGLSIAGIGGIFNPYYFDGLDPQQTPIAPGYTPLDFEAIRSLQQPVDILLTHDAPFGVGFLKPDKSGQPSAVGDPLIGSLLPYLQPRIAVFGHHSVDFERQHGEDPKTRIIGLGKPNHSYRTILFEPASDRMTVDKHAAIQAKSGGSYQYAWEPGVSAPKKEKVTLFGGFIPMDNLERTEAFLKERYREAVVGQLMAEFVGMERPAAVLAFNEARTAVAEAILEIKQHPGLPVESRKKIIKGVRSRFNEKFSAQCGQSGVGIEMANAQVRSSLRAFDLLMVAFENPPQPQGPTGGNTPGGGGTPSESGASDEKLNKHPPTGLRTASRTGSRTARRNPHASRRIAQSTQRSQRRLQAVRAKRAAVRGASARVATRR